MATLRNAVATALACGMLASASIPAARAGDGSEATFGSQWWTQSVNDAKYQEFREQPRGGFLESFVWQQWSGRNSVRLQGMNALRRDQNSKLTWANGARFRLDLGYQEIPHLFSQVARWGWLQSSPGVFVIPDSLRARNQAIPGSYTQRMIDFLRTAPGVRLGFSTDISSARARLRPAKGWQFEARSTLRTRDGLKPYAMSFGFSTALENPEPIDQRMLDVDLVADYHHQNLSLQAIGGLSSFGNDISVLRVDNPKRITSVNGGDGTAQGALDLYPNNEVVRGSLALAYAMPRQSSLSAMLAVAAGNQNDKFLAFTTNSALPQSNIDSLPARSLDAKTTQITGDVRLRTSPSDKLDGSVHFHYNDYQNSTEQLNFIGQAPYEASFQRFAELKSHIFTSTAWQAGADLDFELAPNASVGALVEYRIRERAPREVEKDAETVFGGRTRIRVAKDIQLKADYTRGDRKMDEFLLEEYEGFRPRLAGPTAGVYDSLDLLEQPGLRRYDVANRVQDLASAGLTFPVGDHLELGANYAYMNNDYKSDTGVDTTLGLRSEVSHTVAATATLHVSEQLDLNGSYGFGSSTSDQISRASPVTISYRPDSTWTAKLNDTESFVTAGVAWAPAKSRLTIDADYEISRTMSKFDLGNAFNNAADLPNTFYRRQDVSMEVGWRWLAKTSIIGRYNWEQFDMIDWAANDVPLIFPVVGSSSAIFLGDSSRSYIAHRIALVVRHRF